MPDDEATISGQPASLSGELIALPSLERGVPSLEGHDRGGLGLGLGLGGGTDSVDGAAGARQKALEVVQTAVELADRIETQARESASERLRRADEELDRRRRDLEQRELEIERLSTEFASRDKSELLSNTITQIIGRQRDRLAEHGAFPTVVARLRRTRCAA